MKRTSIAIIMIMSLLCSSCATKSLWEATDPNAYIQIKYTDITEDELQAKGCKYYKDDNSFSYYVNKSSFERFKDYTYRTLGTPFTVVVDAAGLLIVGIGFGLVDNFIEEHREEPDPHSFAGQRR